MCVLWREGKKKNLMRIFHWQNVVNEAPKETMVHIYKRGMKKRSERDEKLQSQINERRKIVLVTNSLLNKNVILFILNLNWNLTQKLNKNTIRNTHTHSIVNMWQPRINWYLHIIHSTIHYIDLRMMRNLIQWK